MPFPSKKKARVVLVTGDSSGIGYACCERLVASGRIVYGASRTKPRRRTWAHIEMDVTSDAAVAKTVSHVLEREGRIDAVVHAAGVSLIGPCEETTSTEAQRLFNINYFGAVRVMREVLPVMRKQKSGKLLLVGSIGALIALPYAGHYSASKAALDALIQAVRPELSPFGIDATVIHPGDLNTKIGAHRKKSAATKFGSPYYDVLRRTARFYDRSEKGARNPDALARKIDLLLDDQKLPVRKVVGTVLERLGVLAQDVIPSRLFEKLLNRVYGP